MRLIFATNNRHKWQEIRRMLPESYELLSLADLGGGADPPELHDTMEENAMEKARFIFNRYGLPCFADDSGLEVEALGGQPGVHSARYAGEEKNDDQIIRKLLNEMSAQQNRSARFKTVIAYVDKNHSELFTGTVEGDILTHPSGSRGFGYDPVFRPEGYAISFAEMSPSEKNKISHRARALALLIKYLNG